MRHLRCREPESDKVLQMFWRREELGCREAQLSGTRLVCHCRADQACHADSIITVYKELFPHAYDRKNNSTAAAPSAEVLNRLARQREIPESDGEESVRKYELMGLARPLTLPGKTDNTEKDLICVVFLRRAMFK